jgi:CubicO group peptidase (beta-lactamase class C family)
MMPYQRLLFRPGERFSYSNPGFIYLARIIESITGDPWQSYIQKNVFSPLGLTRSYFGATPYWLQAHRSHGYDISRAEEEGPARLVDHGADFDPGITIPNGGWNAPVEDLASYAAFLSTEAPVDPGMRPRWEAVLSRSTLEEMWTPRLAVSEDGSGARADSLGLSFFVVRHGDRSMIGHTGSQSGYRAFFYFQPEKEAAVILVFNTSIEAANEAVGEAFDALLSAAFQVADPPNGNDRALPAHGASTRAGPEAHPALR